MNDKEMSQEHNDRQQQIMHRNINMISIMETGLKQKEMRRKIIEEV